MSGEEVSITPPAEPTSRICVKFLPADMNEMRIREKLVLETRPSGVSSKSGPYVNITEVKLLRRPNGTSRCIAFVGFKTIDQAKLAQFYWHKAFIGSSRLHVEFAHPPGHEALTRPWSKYSEGSSARRKIEEKELVKAEKKAAKGADGDLGEELAEGKDTGKKGTKKSKLVNVLDAAMAQKGRISASAAAKLAALASKPVEMKNGPKSGKHGNNMTNGSTDKTTSGSGNSVVNKKKTPEDIKRLKQLKALALHPALLKLTDEEREVVLRDDRFHDYMAVAVKNKSKNNSKFWDNDDQSGETKTLRALYLAGMAGEDGNSKPSIIHGETYESLMADLRKKAKKDDGNDAKPGMKRKREGDGEEDSHGKNKKAKVDWGIDDESSDDEDYFNNPSIDPNSVLNKKKLDQGKGMRDEDGDDDGTGGEEGAGDTNLLIKEILKSNTGGSTDSTEKKKATTNDLESGAGKKKKKSKASDEIDRLTDGDYLKLLKTSNFDSDDDDDDLNDDQDSDDMSDSENEHEDHEVEKKGDDEEDEDEVEDEDEDEEDEDKSDSSGDSENESNNSSTSKDEALPLLSREEEEAIARETGRIFIRNLPYNCLEEEVMKLCEEYGKIVELIMPIDALGKKKGYCAVTYSIPEHAAIALKALTGMIFQGRILAVHGGKLKQAVNEEGGKGARTPAEILAAMGDDEMDKIGYKYKKQLVQKANAGVKDNWNTLFISPQTIAAAAATKFNISKADLLGANQDAEGTNSAAVRLAMAETHMIQQTQEYLTKEGVNIDAFTSYARTGGKTIARSNNIIMIKNIPFDTEEAELKRMFAKHGRITRFILPPYRTIALVMYDQPSEARKAFMQLAYKKFKHLPLYLEWAPEKAIGERLKIKEGQTEEDRVVPLDSNDNNSESKEVEEEESGPRSLFVKNLHFMTTEAQLLEAMARICTIVYKNYTTKLRNQGKDINNLKEWRIRAASIQKRKEEKKGEMLSLGYGFVEVSHAAAASAIVRHVVNQGGIELDGHLLEIKVSDRENMAAGSSAAVAAVPARKQTSILESKGVLTKEKIAEQEEWSKTSSKLVVRNVPFQANLKEIRELFQAFGQLRRCRLPKKFDGVGHRGFAFVDFVTPQEARAAFKALQATHLYGRHLVLEWAAPDDTLEDLRDKAKKSIE